MNKLRVNIVLPFPTSKPAGGPKIMYEYANRLWQLGHSITIYHAIKRPYKNSKTPLFIKQIMFALRGISKPKWFPLAAGIKSLIVPTIEDKFIADADIIFCTWWQMAFAVNDLSPTKGKKFNLIQDYEIWTGQNDLVDKSFALPLHHLVISKYLQQIVFDKTGVRPLHIPNAIDTDIYACNIKPGDKNPCSIIMLYSEELRKGTQFGLAALTELKEKFPQLQVTLFGVYPKPQNLPAWISYYRKPTNLLELYNEAAIFVSPSLTEGWALPPAEAMACGCAVVCTGIGGHADYALNSNTALLTKTENAADIVEKVSLLLTDNSMRLTIANNGLQFITSGFSWHKNVHDLESSFYSAVNK